MSTKLPAKIDIGPVYNVDPQRRKAYTGAVKAPPKLHDHVLAQHFQQLCLLQRVSVA